jgi:hypothetical protein
MANIAILVTLLRMTQRRPVPQVSFSEPISPKLRIGREQDFLNVGTVQAG